MAGDDEARARAVLAEMQFRIAEGPTSALGIGEIVTPAEVRAAFLALTKQYHPARFGRLSAEVQKLSNEVFLGIKGAHDHMLKVLGSSTAGSRGGTRQAIPIAQHGADGTSRTNAARGTQSLPRIEGTVPPQGRDGRSSSPAIMGGRSTPPMGVPIQGGTSRPTTGSVPVLSRDGQGTQRPTGSLPQRPSGSIPFQRPSTPPPVAGSQPGSRPITPVPPGTVPGFGSTPSGGSQPPRAGTPPSAGSSQPISRPITPVPPGTQPGIGTTPASQRVALLRDSLTPPTQPPRPTHGIAPPTQPPRPTPGIAPPTQPPRPTPGIAPPTQPPRVDFNPPTVRNVQTPTTTAGGGYGAGSFDEEAAFRDATTLMEKKEWAAARQALHALAARVPQSKTYRAWLCYARGREAYLAGRPDDAILDMQRALQLDPDLAHAKHALAELQRRR